MKGAIVGDIAGSRFEFEPLKSTDFDLFGRDPAPCRYTDDTVMTAAVADALLTYDALQAEGRTTPLEEILIDSFHAFGNRHLHVGFGHWQYEWLKYRKREPYNSFGNGSAMRVSPVGWYAQTLDETLDLAKATAAVTHNHPEGIKGAQAIAACVFLARNGHSKSDIANFVDASFYPGFTSIPLDAIRPKYSFDVTCQGSVPQSIVAFLESTGFEEAVKLAISLGGDADTMGDMAGAIAEAFFGIDPHIWETAETFLDEDIVKTVTEFYATYC